MSFSLRGGVTGEIESLRLSSWITAKLGDIIVKMPKADHGAKEALDQGEYPFFYK